MQKHIADKPAALAAKQNNGKTHIALAPGKRMNSGSNSSSTTSCTPEAAPGTTVGAGEQVAQAHEEQNIYLRLTYSVRGSA